LTDDADGFGGGILPGDAESRTAEARTGAEVGLAAGETDSGTGYGGGGGIEDQERASESYAAQDDGQGFGGGSVS
jgi:hypothetical protein